VICTALFGKSIAAAAVWLQFRGPQLRQIEECRGVSAAASGVASLTSLAARRDRRASERPCQGHEVEERIREYMPGLSKASGHPVPA